MPETAVVVGSGIGGIATAIRLRVQGHQVAVYEANAYPGGKLTSIAQDGFRFDAGPSLFTLPELVDELYTLAGRDPRASFNYRSMDTVCHYFFEDGTRLESYRDPKRLAKELDAHLTPGAGKQALEYLEKSARTYQLTSKIFLEQSLHKLGNYLSRDVLKALVNVASLNLTRSLDKVNERHFDDDRLVQLFNRYATYNGSSPYLTPGVMSLIPHLEYNVGTFFPEGGMHTITTGLVDLAKSIGVEFHFGARVERIVVEKQKAAGIQVNGQHVPATIVVSNMDIVPTYRHLLPDLPQPRQVLEQERSSSALIFYWGMDRTFPELDLHNIFFSADYKEEFDHLFRHKTLYEDPTVYINISSKYCPDDAPAGMENWFVMVNAPFNTGQDWDRYIEQARISIQEKVTRLLDLDIRTHIQNESILEPRTIESRTSSFRGSLYGASSNHWLSAFVRHPNFHRKVKGLYFCGGSVHPGGGIPLALLSGKIVGNLVQQQHDR